jgi:hypothetical protein
MLQKIATIKLTFIGLSWLIASLLTGVALTFDDRHAAALKSLSRQLPLTWLISEGGQDPVITTWFVLVCLIAVLFFIHLACCLLTRFIHLIHNKYSGRQWLFFTIHVLFALVMAGHGLSMVMGSKQSGVTMFAGQTMKFNKEYVLSLSEVVYTDDTAMLNASYENRRAMMTRENIHREKNYAAVSITKNGRILADGHIHMLTPLRFGSWRITLTDFFISRDRPHDPVGIKLVITDNPILPFFFSTYAAMIMALLGFIIITWRNGKKRG